MFGLKKKDNSKNSKDNNYVNNEDTFKEDSSKPEKIVEPHSVVRDNNNLGDYLNSSYNDAEDARVKKLIKYLIMMFKYIREVDTEYELTDSFHSLLNYADPENHEAYEMADYLETDRGYNLMSEHYDYLKSYFGSRGVKVSWEQGDPQYVYSRNKFIFSWGDLKEEDKANNLTTAKIDGNAIKCKDWSEE